MDSLEKIAENPFLAAVLITIALAFIFYSFIVQYLNGMPTTKIMVKAFVYMYLSTLLFFYLHSRTVKKYYESTVNNQTRLASVSRTGSNELEVRPDMLQRPQPSPAVYNNTNEFI